MKSWRKIETEAAMWFARSLKYLPVRIQQLQDGDQAFDATLIKYMGM